MKWSDIKSPFILDDNIICLIALLDVLVQKMVTKKHKKIGIPAPPPPPIYDFFLNFTIFLVLPLVFQFQTQLLDL